MSKDLAKQDPVTDEFWSGFEKKDFFMPKVTIGQGTPGKGKKLGYFNFSTGGSVEILKGVVMLGKSDGMVLFGGKGNVPARCASDDGKFPAERILNPITPISAGGCLHCPMKDWGHDERKDALMLSLKMTPKDDKPICQESMDIMMVDAAGDPFVLNIRTSNVKLAQKFIFPGVKLKSLRHPTKAPYGVAFDLALEALPGEGGRHAIYIPKESWRYLEGIELEERSMLCEMWGGQKVKQVVSQIHAAQDTQNAQIAGGDDDDDMPF